MARLQSIGFELNSATDGVEEKDFGNVIIGTTNVRSGNYAARDNDAIGTNYLLGQVYSANQARIGFLRVYLYIVSAPSADSLIMGFALTNGTYIGGISLKTDRTLQLKARNESNIGSVSSALALNTWHMLELAYDATSATDTLEGKLDGTSFASGNNSSNGDWGGYYIAGFSNSSARDLWFDDLALNDDTGSFQNSWPGEGSIIHLRPNAEGDTVDWSNGVSSTNWENVDEVTPDDASTVNTSTNLNDIDEYNLDATPAAINSDDTINCVQVGLRIGNSASATHGYTPRIKAAASGTVEEGTEITITNSTFVTHSPSVPKIYNLTLYDLPGASTTPWTKADLDTAQIGVKHTTDAAFNAQVSTMWLLVDYAPASGEGGGDTNYGRFFHFFPVLGMGALLIAFVGALNKILGGWR